jgi:hypothetical protein
MRSLLIRSSAITLLCLLLLVACFSTAQETVSKATVLETTALRLAPSNVSFFQTSLKLKDRLLTLWNSKAVQQAWKTSLVQGWWKEFSTNLLQQAGPFSAMLEQPENKELANLLLDMASEEAFVMGGESFGDFLTLVSDVYMSQQFSGLEKLFNGGGGNDPSAQLHSIFSTLQENLATLKAPEIIVGFKVADQKVAKRQLARLSVLLNTAALAVPQLTGNVKTQKVNESSFTTVILDGSKVPWDQIPWAEIEEENGEFDDLKAHLKGMKINISIGYHEGYILFSLGESMNFLKSMGKGKKLAELDEFKPLLKHLDKRITSVGYSSKQFNANSGFTREQADVMFNTWKEMLENSDLEDGLRERITKDLQELSGDLLKLMEHEPGSAMSFSFLTERGEETFRNQYSVDPGINFSKTLELFQHVGGDPLLVSIGRHTHKPEGWDFFVKWTKKANGYLREYGLPQLVGIFGQELVDKIEDLLDNLYPIFAKVNDTVKANLLPALADGQAGFVLDNKLLSTQWHREMPASETPLPILEPAVLFGVSDNVKLKKGASDIRGLFNDAAKQVQKTFGDDVPEIVWPAPETRTIEGYDLFWYSFKDEFQLDGRLRPSAGLSKNLCALTVSNEHALRLMQATPFVSNATPLKDIKRPLASATYFRVSGLVDTAQPWIAYALAHPELQEAKVHAKDIMTIVNALKYFHSYSSATYLENKTTVTHSEWHVKDVP